MTASIYTMDGAELTTGLQGCTVCDEAIDLARRTAAERGEDVHLVDDDGEWIAHADGSPATPYAPVVARCETDARASREE